MKKLMCLAIATSVPYEIDKYNQYNNKGTMIMNQELSPFVETDNIFKEIAKTAHFDKFRNKPSELMLILCTAKQIGMGFFQAVNGGLEIIAGKVTMPAKTMNAIIRAKGHSIVALESTASKCVVKGVRKDGDSFTSEYTFEEAQKAGLTSKDNWRKHPTDMLFARAMSRLARQLFPDVILDCYVEGEIEPFNKNKTDDVQITRELATIEALEQPNEKEEPKVEEPRISKEQTDYLTSMVIPEIEDTVKSCLKSRGYENMSDLKVKEFATFESGIKNLLKGKQNG